MCNVSCETFGKSRRNVFSVSLKMFHMKRKSALKIGNNMV